MRMSKKRIEEKLTRLLQRLGNTPAAVAKYFEKAGIKGACGEAFDCPVSRRVEMEFPGLEVASDNVSVAVFMDEKNVVEVPTPEPVAQFMDDFDDKLYVHLIDKTEAKKHNSEHCS